MTFDPLTDEELAAWLASAARGDSEDSTTTSAPIVIQPTKFIPADGGPPMESGISLTELHKKFEEHLYLPDLVAVDVAAATVVAHRAGGDPLWMFFVSPPSAGKTELVASVGGCPEVYRLSSLTGQTFVSGFKGRSWSTMMRFWSEPPLLYPFPDPDVSHAATATDAATSSPITSPTASAMDTPDDEGRGPGGVRLAGALTMGPKEVANVRGHFSPFKPRMKVKPRFLGAPGLDPLK